MDPATNITRVKLATSIRAIPLVFSLCFFSLSIIESGDLILAAFGMLFFFLGLTALLLRIDYMMIGRDGIYLFQRWGKKLYIPLKLVHSLDIEDVFEIDDGFSREVIIIIMLNQGFSAPQKPLNSRLFRVVDLYKNGNIKKIRYSASFGRVERHSKMT